MTGRLGNKLLLLLLGNSVNYNINVYNMMIMIYNYINVLNKFTYCTIIYKRKKISFIKL